MYASILPDSVALSNIVIVVYSHDFLLKDARTLSILAHLRLSITLKRQIFIYRRSVVMLSVTAPYLNTIMVFVTTKYKVLTDTGCRHMLILGIMNYKLLCS